MKTKPSTQNTVGSLCLCVHGMCYSIHSGSVKAKSTRINIYIYIYISISFIPSCIKYIYVYINIVYINNFAYTIHEITHINNFFWNLLIQNKFGLFFYTFPTDWNNVEIINMCIHILKVDKSEKCNYNPNSVYIEKKSMNIFFCVNKSGTHGHGYQAFSFAIKTPWLKLRYKALGIIFYLNIMFHIAQNLFM